MTCGPRTQISPTAPMANSPPASSRMEISVEAIGRPIEPLKSVNGRLMQAPGEVSVRPHAWVKGLPVAACHGFLHRHAATERDLQMTEIDFRKLRIMEQGVEQRVDAAEEGKRIAA